MPKKTVGSYNPKSVDWRKYWEGAGTLNKSVKYVYNKPKPFND